MNAHLLILTHSFDIRMEKMMCQSVEASRENAWHNKIRRSYIYIQ